MSPLGLVILDRKGPVLFSSPAGEEILTAFPSIAAICARMTNGAERGEHGCVEMLVKSSRSACWCSVRVVALKKRMEDLPAVVAVFVEAVDVLVEGANADNAPVDKNTWKINGMFKLSRRETEVVEAVEVGMTDKQIAIKLGVSPETVRGYLKAVRSKLGVSTRTAILHKIHQS
ncbi:MAG: helix-turn-helix transcriptional regulator [Gammaproteobacteria bacterium]